MIYSLRSASFMGMLCASILLAGCAGSRRFSPPPPVPDDRNHVPLKPEELATHIMADGFQRQVVQPGADLFDLSRWLRKVSGRPQEAMNVNAFDEVPNSSWFTNRNASRRMTPEEIYRGPNTVQGPDLDHPLTVVKAKTLGITPGFVIEDARGDRYVIKLDPPGFNELNSGAEVVTTKLLYAAGYHVPENFAVEINPVLLAVGEQVKFTGNDGIPRHMNDEDLREIISKVQLTEDGRIRAMASKYIDGVPIGPFFFKGTRKDDPNDFIPHEHRRELRGARVVFAWLGHYDTNASNFLDGYVTENDRSYVRHYLIDFGAALGSHPAGAKPADRGDEPYMDPIHMLRKTAELGLVVRDRDRQQPVRYSSVGRFGSDGFHPKRFKFIFPTRAFEYYTPRDAYWGAKIVASFTEEQIRAAVDAGNYSDEGAKEYLLQTLMERREILCRYWFSRVAPLDNFRNTDLGIEFSDLAIEAGFEFDNDTSYRWRVHYEDGPTHWTVPEAVSRVIPFESIRSGIERYALEVQVRRGAGSWSESVFAYFELRDETFRLIGVEHRD